MLARFPLPRMNKLWLLLLAVVSLAAAEADPALPSELKLTTGATLHNARPTRWEKEQVVVRHNSGLDAVRYANIVEAQRSQVLTARDAALKAKAAESAKAVEASKLSRTLDGQAFIVTRCAGNYKPGGMAVYAFAASRLSAFETLTTIDLGKPIASSRTDAEGTFRIQLPSEEDFFIYARGSRLAGRESENYEWIVKSAEIADRSQVLLSSHNNRTPAARAVKIETD